MLGKHPNLKVCENCFWAKYSDSRFIKCNKSNKEKGLLEVCCYFLKDKEEDKNDKK